MQKVKNVLGEFLRSKQLRTVMMCAMLMAVTCISAFADEGGGSADAIQSAFQSGFSSFVSDAKSMLGMIVTVAIPLACTLFLARKALSWFKSIAK